MNYQVLAIGKPKLRYAAQGIEEYRERLRRQVPVDIAFLKTRTESQTLLERSEGTFRVALDERGEQLTTEALVDQINRLEQRGDIKTLSFLIGGADGHEQALRDTCDRVWSLSALTLQHELALVVLLEQLYRAFSIKRGEPYHRS